MSTKTHSCQARAFAHQTLKLDSARFANLKRHHDFPSHRSCARTFVGLPAESISSTAPALEQYEAFVTAMERGTSLSAGVDNVGSGKKVIAIQRFVAMELDGVDTTHYIWLRYVCMYKFCISYVTSRNREIVMERSAWKMLLHVKIKSTARKKKLTTDMNTA
jgi:hypothetical protein